MNETKFNIFSFIFLIQKNLLQFFIIIALCLSITIYYYSTKSYTFTATTEITALDNIQNGFAASGYKTTQLFQLVNNSLYGKKAITKSHTDYSRLKKLEMSQSLNNDFSVQNVVKSISIKRDERLITEISFVNKNPTYAEEFLTFHISNIEDQVKVQLRKKIEADINYLVMQLTEENKNYERSLALIQKNLQNSIKLIDSSYPIEKKNILNYIKQNRDIAEAMDLSLPVPAIINFKEAEKFLTTNQQVIEKFSQKRETVSNVVFQKYDYQSNNQGDSVYDNQRVEYVTIKEIIMAARFLDKPAYLFGTKILNKIINSIENDNIPEIDEIKTSIQKKMEEIRLFDYNKNEKIFRLNNRVNVEKLRLQYFDYATAETSNLVNTSYIVDVKYNGIRLSFLLIIGFIVGLLISLLTIIPYRELINSEGNEQSSKHS